MLELFLGAARVSEYPDSGPGNKRLLKGSAYSGYFGVIPQAEVFSAQTLINELALSAKPYSGQGLRWLKTSINGKYLFVPTEPIALSISYTELYAAGLVFGVDDIGQVPLTPNVNQLRIVIKTDYTGRKWGFAVRLLKGSVSNPTPGGVDELRDPSVEASLLISKVTAVGGPTDGGESWDTLTGNDVWMSAYFWTQSQRSGTGVCVAYGTQYTPAYNLTTKSTTVGWVPCLELVDLGSMTLAPADIELSCAEYKPPSVAGNAPTDRVLPVSAIQVDTDAVALNVVLDPIDYPHTAHAVMLTDTPAKAVTIN